MSYTLTISTSEIKAVAVGFLVATIMDKHDRVLDLLQTVFKVAVDTVQQRPLELGCAFAAAAYSYAALQKTNDVVLKNTIFKSASFAVGCFCSNFIKTAAPSSTNFLSYPLLLGLTAGGAYLAKELYARHFADESNVIDKQKIAEFLVEPIKQEIAELIVELETTLGSICGDADQIEKQLVALAAHPILVKAASLKSDCREIKKLFKHLAWIKDELINDTNKLIEYYTRYYDHESGAESMVTITPVQKEQYRRNVLDSTISAVQKRLHRAKEALKNIESSLA